MGIQINYFVDHDLSLDSVKTFLSEFLKRTHEDNHWKIEADTNLCDFESFFPNTQGNISIYNFTDNLQTQIELDLSMKTLQIFSLPHFDEIDCFWENLNKEFSENTVVSKKRISQLISTIKENIVPVFHSTKLILFNQETFNEHKVLYKEKLIENGCSIEEVLKYNKTFDNPCAILTNENAYKNYSDLYQPIYLFDL